MTADPISDLPRQLVEDWVVHHEKSATDFENDDES